MPQDSRTPALPVQAPDEWREGKVPRMASCFCCGWSEELIDYYGSYRAALAVACREKYPLDTRDEGC